MLKNLKNKKKKGFTLIELIIVIAIIAILAVIAIPKFVDVRENAAQKTDITNAKTIANAAATLYANGDIEDEASGSAVVKKAAAEAANNGEEIADYLQDIPKTKAVHGSAAAGSNFWVVISGGDVTVYAGSKADTQKLYPAPTE